MSDFFESGNFNLPSEVHRDMTGRLKEVRQIKSLEFQLKGEGLEDAEAFSRILRALKKSGVKISHEFSIKLDFPKAVPRQKALEILQHAPKPLNGSLKVRAEAAILSGEPL